ncbi:MAG: NFACT family protein [Lachnospiraceae bacterium]|nr:NFACT family protein [Lachnospiraceae bacterium]
MAFDGVTIANIVSEMKKELLEGRVYKIAQPEADELLLTIKTKDGQRRLLISVNASLPLIYLTESNKPSPMTAPNFCMLLRKHLQNGRITAITQPGLERIIQIHIEHLDEMGDLCRKTLIVEIMGKHSNIIFCDAENRIIDSIKRVSAAVSSVREVLPGKPYFIAQTQEKLDLLTTDYQTFYQTVSAKPQPLFKALYGSFTGISPILAQELCYRAGLDGEASTASFAESAYHLLYLELEKLKETIQAEAFAPCIAYQGKQPVEYAAVPLTMYAGTAGVAGAADVADDLDKVHTQALSGDHLVPCDGMSALVETYYAEKNTLTRIRQKSADLRQIVQTALERNVKKYDLQLKQMQDTEKRETYRIYGELLNTYGYSAAPGARSIEVINYYTNEPLTIPLDETLSATDNARHYFEKYNKLKRTYEALSELTQEVKAEIDHLESIGTSLDIALKEEDLVEIRRELAESGYIKHAGGLSGGGRSASGKNGVKGNRNAQNAKSGKAKTVSKPFHYLSSDGFHIYVGKNNFQNDELTFQFASGNDWWFHAKKMPGSHVVVKTDGVAELPDRVFEEAARLAAYYSKGRGSDKVEIDYIQKKHVKKPGGAKPGFVVYYTNFSMVTDSDITGIQLLEQ